MLLTTLVLVTIDGEHDCLQQRINLGHRDQSAKVSDVSRLRLEQEQQIAVLLSLVIVGEEALLHIGRIFQVTGYFVLLGLISNEPQDMLGNPSLTSSRAMRFWISKAILESR